MCIIKISYDVPHSILFLLFELVGTVFAILYKITSKQMLNCKIKSTVSYLIEDFLQVRGPHAISQVAIGRVAEEELPLSCHGSSNVLFSINIFLTPVHNSNVAYRGHQMSASQIIGLYVMRCAAGILNSAFHTLNIYPRFIVNPG